MGITLDTLYKRAESGKIVTWNISVEGSTITVKYGQEGGAIQTATENVYEGKNLGRSNATTPEQQAELQARAKWLKQQERGGYVTDRAKALAGERLRETPKPMLAHKFSDQSGKIVFPAAIQPKLDGIRCLATINDDGVTLSTRSGEVIKSMPHIQDELAELISVGHGELILDGELYNHDYRNDFEKITSMVKRKEPHMGATTVQYHVYDIHTNKPFSDRSALLRHLVGELNSPSIVFVETFTCSAEDFMEYFDRFRADGYEGAMLRNFQSPYESKRSYHLQKVKDFQDAEYEIIGVKEGKGKMEGRGIFRCKTVGGGEFDVKCEGSLDELNKYLENSEHYIGKLLTVKYQNLTADGIPRFPVGKGIRENGI